MINSSFFKYAGIILISLGSALCGYFKAGKTREEIQLRNALFDLIVHIRNEISLKGTALKEIYSDYRSEILERCGFLGILKSDCQTPFENALLKIKPCLPHELYLIYGNLAGTLGKSRSEKCETELLSRCISDIEAKERLLITKDKAKIQLYSRFGVLFGLLSAIIFI